MSWLGSRVKAEFPFILIQIKNCLKAIQMYILRDQNITIVRLTRRPQGISGCWIVHIEEENSGRFRLHAIKTPEGPGGCRGLHIVGTYRRSSANFSNCKRWSCAWGCYVGSRKALQAFDLPLFRSGRSKLQQRRYFICNFQVLLRYHLPSYR